MMSGAWRVSKELTRLYRVQEMPTGSNCYYKNATTIIFIPRVINLRRSNLTLNNIHNEMAFWVQNKKNTYYEGHWHTY